MRKILTLFLIALLTICAFWLGAVVSLGAELYKDLVMLFSGEEARQVGASILDCLGLIENWLFH